MTLASTAILCVNGDRRPGRRPAVGQLQRDVRQSAPRSIIAGVVAWCAYKYGHWPFFGRHGPGGSENPPDGLTERTSGGIGRVGACAGAAAGGGLRSGRTRDGGWVGGRWPARARKHQSEPTGPCTTEARPSGAGLSWQRRDSKGVRPFSSHISIRSRTGKDTAFRDEFALKMKRNPLLLSGRP